MATGDANIHERDWTPVIRDREAKWKHMHDELAAAGIERINLWTDKNPMAPNGFKAGMYMLPVHSGEPRGTFIVCAGGAFKFKSSNEAKPVAEYFHRAGFNAAILDYTVDGSAPDSEAVSLAACEDALQAIRYLRANAKNLGIRADKIAIGGFSAGGITSQLAATRYDHGDQTASDPIQRVSSRPDAVLLLYGAFSHTTSVSWLNYQLRVQNHAASIDPIRNIRIDCPPMFIFQTNMDDPRNGLLFALELAHRGIAHEIHTFADGPHGGGLYNGSDTDTPDFLHTSRWAMLAAEWLEAQGF